ncbi:MAG: hypothetical protein RLZZ505_108 [Verrucomicrobiota bacterium]
MVFPLLTAIPLRAALALACVSFAATVSRAEETKTADADSKPEIVQLDKDNYRIGELSLNKQTREIRFPALVNMREGFLEFLVVHEHGAVHESLFRTSVSPTHINLALTLLRYKASKEFYRILDKDGKVTEKFHEVPEETRRAARLEILVEYEKDGETKRISANEWVRHETTAKSMPPSHWVYGGSDFYQGNYIPEGSGQIAAIFITDTAIINFPGDDNTNDEVWTVMSERIPDLETKVTLVIAPHNEP